VTGVQTCASSDLCAWLSLSSPSGGQKSKANAKVLCINASRENRTATHMYMLQKAKRIEGVSSPLRHQPYVEPCRSPLASFPCPKPASISFALLPTAWLCSVRSVRYFGVLLLPLPLQRDEQNCFRSASLDPI
jgi:hypothetical protein